MSFHVNAEELCVDDDHILVGKLPNEDGDLVDAEIDLNEFIGNEDGQFQWYGQDFSSSASNVEFHLEGDEEEQVPILRAELQCVEGDPIAADLNLAERIANINGEFEFN